MEDYDDKLISDLDDVIAKLNRSGSLTIEQYLAESKNSKEYWYGLCQILILEGWIKATGDKDTVVSIIFKTDSFHGLLLGGNLAERHRKYKAKEFLSNPLIINARDNLNVSLNNNAPLNQTITHNSDIENCLSSIAAELERNNAIHQEDREEIIELLEYIRESLQDHHKPLNSVMKRLRRYGNTIVALAPYVDLLTKYFGVS